MDIPRKLGMFTLYDGLTAVESINNPIVISPNSGNINANSSVPKQISGSTDQDTETVYGNPSWWTIGALIVLYIWAS